MQTMWDHAELVVLQYFGKKILQRCIRHLKLIACWHDAQYLWYVGNLSIIMVLWLWVLLIMQD